MRKKWNQKEREKKEKVFEDTPGSRYTESENTVGEIPMSTNTIAK
jgi:hypothetical protein